MKRLLVCLLLVGVVGCGTSPSPEPPLAQDDRPKPPLAQNKSPKPPPVDTDVEKAGTELNKGVDFAAREDWAAAVADYTEAIRIDPDDAIAYGNRGYAYDLLDEKAKAEADFAKVKELGYEPDDE
jgi:Flp pilus assembly protein TadD